MRNQLVKEVFAGVCIVVAALALSATVFAHHGTNISYDHNKPTTMEATVTEFVWQNPHSQLYFDVKSPGGSVEKWAGELSSPGNLAKAGNWTRRNGDSLSCGTG